MTRKKSPDFEILPMRQMRKYKTNPLIEAHTLNVRKQKRVMTGPNVNDFGAGETTIVTEEEVDASMFVKVFDAGVKAAYELSAPASKVYQLVLKVVATGRMNNDQAMLYPAMIPDMKVKMSAATYWRGMRELVAKNFLAASDKPNVYWTNPYFFVKGDTVTIVRRYFAKKTAMQNQIETTPAIAIVSPEPSLFDG